MKRHPAMRARVSQGERLANAISADHERDFEERGFVKLVAMYAVRRKRTIPEAREHQSVRGLPLWGVEVGHEDS
jgi:hypothetical protein